MNHYTCHVMGNATLTDLLTALERGDTDAYGRAFELLYDELRRLARAHGRRWHGEPPLGTTALVHEAYVKLAGAEGLGLEGRGHFLGVASRAMRHLLCNHARDRRRLKRGGHLRRTTAEPDELGAEVRSEDLDSLIALDEALDRLTQIDERGARVIECRFFAGLSIPETAEAIGTSPATVKRDWVLARAWLYQTLVGEPSAA